MFFPSADYLHVVPLPELIEIVPLTKPVHAEITVPGSKSITNRALVLAALAEGETTLLGALWSEDTQVMVECLQELGYMVNVSPDPNEPCNRTITVYGQGGHVPRGGTIDRPLELFVGNAGTAARFLAAMVCLGEGGYRLHGVPRMHERPQAALFDALRELGYRIDSPNDKLPALIHGAGRKSGAKCTASIEESSQFASAVLLCANLGGWQVKVVGENAEESPYVAMTLELIKAFPQGGGNFQIEPDASSGSYFVAASSFELDHGQKAIVSGSESGFVSSMALRATVSVARWPISGWQIDQRFTLYASALAGPPAESFNDAFAKLPEATARSFQAAQETLLSHSPEISSPSEDAERIFAGIASGRISRRLDLGDSVMTAVVLAAQSEYAWTFTDLGRLRVQECERVVALRTELTKCGARVIETGDILEVLPSKLHGAEIETYNDHRMAMCFAILGLKIPGIKIKNPACVKKTFPNFFQKLAAAPPPGLGATILDAAGRPLSHDDLFAG